MNYMKSSQIDWHKGWSKTRLRDLIIGAFCGAIFFGIGAAFAAAFVGFML